MESIDGAANKKVFDDTAKPATNVLHSSLKPYGQLLATAGKIVDINASGLLNLTPHTNHPWISNNTFTCPFTGTWIVWINIGTYPTSSASTILNIQKNNTPPVKFFENLFFENNYLPLQLLEKDVISLSTNKKSFILPNIGSYCFEFVAF